MCYDTRTIDRQYRGKKMGRVSRKYGKIRAIRQPPREDSLTRTSMTGSFTR